MNNPAKEIFLLKNQEISSGYHTDNCIVLIFNQFDWTNDGQGLKQYQQSKIVNALLYNGSDDVCNILDRVFWLKPRPPEEAEEIF